MTSAAEPPQGAPPPGGKQREALPRGTSAAEPPQGALPPGGKQREALPRGDLQRPFRILGVQQVAVGSSSKERLRRLWIDCLGLTVEGHYRSERENVDEDIAVAGRGLARCEVDLMQPIDPAGKPAVHDPPLNHVGLWVDDLPAAVAWLRGQGVRFAPGGIRKGAAGHDIAFIHPRPSEEFPIGGEGVLIELVQAPPEVVAGAGP